jgi:hypothetical protein
VLRVPYRYWDRVRTRLELILRRRGNERYLRIPAGRSGREVDIADRGRGGSRQNWGRRLSLSTVRFAPHNRRSVRSRGFSKPDVRFRGAYAAKLAFSVGPEYGKNAQIAVMSGRRPVVKGVSLKLL